MKRDWELIRKLTLYIRDHDSDSEMICTSDPEFVEHFEKAGYTDKQIVYHLQLMLDANLFIGFSEPDITGSCDWEIERLTNSGHDFIDQASNDEVWKKSMEKLKPLGTVTIQILQGVLTAVIKESLGLH